MHALTRRNVLRVGVALAIPPGMVTLITGCNQSSTDTSQQSESNDDLDPGTLGSKFLPNASLGQAVHTGEFTLEDVIPAGDVEIEFLDIRMSTRGQELAAKMQAALASKKAWWLNYVKESSELGEPLPYHANIGLTKNEYDEFLQASENQKVAETGIKWKCKFTVSGGGMFIIVPVGHQSATLRSIRISFRDNAAFASDVSLGQPQWRARRAKGSALGPWRGYLWKKTEGTIESIAAGERFSLTELDVLHRIGTDKLLFRHKYQVGRNRQNTESKEFMFQVASPKLR